METGAFGWKFDDEIQPVLDEYDRQIANIRLNGAEGQLPRMQAQDEAPGVAAGNVPGMAVPRAGDGSLIPLAGPPRAYGDDSNLRPVYLDEPTDMDLGARAAAARNAELERQHVLGTVYSDFNTALGAWADIAQPFQQKYDTEFNSRIHAVPGGWKIGTASSDGSRCLGGAQTCRTDPKFSGTVPGGPILGLYSHPNNFVRQ